MFEFSIVVLMSSGVLLQYSYRILKEEGRNLTIYEEGGLMVVEMRKYRRSPVRGCRIEFLGFTSHGLEFLVDGSRQLISHTRQFSKLAGYEVELIDYSDKKVVLDFKRKSFQERV